MHELAIARSIVGIVSEAAAGRPVRRLTLEVGALSGVMAAAIAFCFEEVARGTRLEGAVLEIREIAGRARCQDCGADFPTPALYTPCPCGSRRSARLAGEELTIKTIEVETA